MYFINEKEAVKFLVDFVLPYLNADKPSRKELDDLFMAFATKEELDLYNEYQKKTCIESSDEPLTPKNEEKALEAFTSEPKEVIERKNDICKRLLLAKYKDKYEALVKLQNETARITEASFEKSDNSFLMYDFEAGESIYFKIYNFDNFMIWLLKTALYKSFDEDRNIRFINYEHLPQMLRNEKYLKPYLLDVYEDYVEVIKNYMSDVPITKFDGYGNTEFLLIESTRGFDSIFNLMEAVTSHAVLKCLYSSFRIKDMPNSSIEDKRQLIEDGFKYRELRRENASIERIEKTLKKPVDDFIAKGEGFNHIGLCLECQKLFKKNRSDKEYCSLKCSKLATSRIAKAKARNKNLITD